DGPDAGKPRPLFAHQGTGPSEPVEWHGVVVLRVPVALPLCCGSALVTPTDAFVAVASRPVVRDQAGRFAAGSGQPPRRHGGGQPGNMNASLHPWETFLERKAVRRQDRWILPFVSAYEADLVAHKGGPDVVTVATLRVIELAGLARGALMLAMAAAASGAG